VINRLWDIAGRKYDGVYPIDFHLSLTGYEVNEGGTTVSGRTEVSLSVRGAYTESDQPVQDEWTSLRKRIKLALEGRRLNTQVSPNLTSCDFISELAASGQISSHLAAELIARVQADLRIAE
jgi:hypothetical protein